MTEALPRNRTLSLKRRHPLYDASVQQYDFLYASYMGGEAYDAETYLDKYLRESAAQYKERQARAYYLNYTAAVVDAYISAVFRRDPTRELPDSMRGFEEDATGEGNSLTDLTREAMTWALAALRAYVMVDIAQDGTPYAHLIHPSNLFDYAVDPRTGEYLWALIAEEYVEEEDPFTDRVIEERYRLWTPSEWMLFDKHGTQIDSERNLAGVVPLIEAAPGNLPLPMVDIAKINRRIYNICSQIDEILCNVTFPQPYLQVGEDGIEDTDGTAISPDVSPIQMGTTKMFLLPEDANIPPGYLVPPDGPLQRQMEERERLIQAIYSLAGLERTAPDDTQQPQSGVAKAYDFRETNARLGALAQASERLEFEMLELLSAYGFSGEFNVAYRKDYNVRDFRLVLEDYVVISDTNLPAVVKKRSALELAGQIAEDASPEEKQEIQEAVEAMDDAAFAPPPTGLESLLGTPATGSLSQSAAAQRFAAGAGDLRDVTGE
jgi:hypothetical protein